MENPFFPPHRKRKCPRTGENHERIGSKNGIFSKLWCCLLYFAFLLYFYFSSPNPSSHAFSSCALCIHFVLFFAQKKKLFICKLYLYIHISRICMSRICVSSIWQACLEQITYFSPIFIVAVARRRR